jgi:hypothetical protein
MQKGKKTWNKAERAVVSPVQSHAQYRKSMSSRTIFVHRFLAAASLIVPLQCPPVGPTGACRRMVSAPGNRPLQAFVPEPDKKNPFRTLFVPAHLNPFPNDNAGSSITYSRARVDPVHREFMDG